MVLYLGGTPRAKKGMSPQRIRDPCGMPSMLRITGTDCVGATLKLDGNCHSDRNDRGKKGQAKPQCRCQQDVFQGSLLSLQVRIDRTAWRLGRSDHVTRHRERATANERLPKYSYRGILLVGVISLAAVSGNPIPIERNES